MSLTNNLKKAGDTSLSSNPGGRALEIVGKGMWAGARTVGMALATVEVSKEAIQTGKDLFTGAEPSSYLGKAADNILGGFGQAIVVGGLAIAAYNCAADTVLSGVNGFKDVVAA